MATKVHERAARLDELLRRLLGELGRGDSDPLSDLPLAQLRLLRSLSEGEKNLTELSEELDSSPSAISQLVQRLCGAGLVTKEEDEADRRVKRLSLTPRGAKMLRRRYALRRSRAAEMLARMPESNQERLLQELAVLVQDGSAGQQGKIQVPAGVERGLVL